MPAMRSNSRRRQNRSDSRPAIEQMDWTLGQWIDRPTEPVDEDTLEKVHQNALRILEEIGILFLNSEARDILRGIGCEVDDVTENVRFDRALVLDAIAKAPGRFTITPRNEDRQIILGDGHFLLSLIHI